MSSMAAPKRRAPRIISGVEWLEHKGSVGKIGETSRSAHHRRGRQRRRDRRDRRNLFPAQ